MHSTVVLDGTVMPLQTVRLDAFMSGFAYGRGLFETIRIEHGRARFLGRHLRRLRSSLQSLYDVVETCPPERLDASALWPNVVPALATLAKDGAAFDGVMKLVVSGGHLLVTFRDLGADHQQRLSGVTIDAIDAHSYRHHDPLRNHKTLAYLANYRAMQRGMLFSNERDEICEAATANVIVELDGELVTPPLDAPCLPGIAREIMLGSAAHGAPDVHERPLLVRDLARVDACVLTNAVSVALPVTRLLGRALDAGSARLAEHIRQRVQRASDV